MKKIINIFKYLVLASLLTLVSWYFIVVQSGNILVSGGKGLTYFASKITKICSTSAYRPACYDKEIPKLVAKNLISMEDAFSVTSIIQKNDREYLYCHILGHNLADEETKKDPDKWLDVITRCPALACNNGCAHGAIMRKFKGTEILSNSQIAEIMPDLSIACEPRDSWLPTELERSMCYHSLGHLGLYITGADIDKSLEICKKVGIKSDGRSYYQTCASGVFMLIFQALDDDDAALVANVKPAKDQVVRFCSRYQGLENTACRTESWPYFFDEFAKPEGLVKFCSFTSDKYFRNWCFDTGLRGGLTLKILQTQGPDGVSRYCAGLPEDIKGRCFASVANSWVQDEPNYISDSVALCKAAEKYGFSEECYNGLLYFSKFSFNKGSDLWKNYCNEFPENYKTRCFSGDTPEGW